MILGAYCILDAKAGSFGVPMFRMTDPVAIREFRDMCANPERGNVLHSHPEDFTLYHVGTFDTETARLEAWDTVRALVTASALSSVEEKSERGDLFDRTQGVVS